MGKRPAYRLSHALFQRLFLYRYASRAQTLYLNASDSVDDDQVDEAAFDFAWTCIDDAGGDCESSTGSILELGSFVRGTTLTVPADALPVGEIQTVLGQLFGVISSGATF